MKFFRFFTKEKTQKTLLKTIPEQDMRLLAFMCRCSEAVVVKKELFRESAYAYYIPFKEEYVSVAQKIFAKNGINMVVHNSAILGEDRQNVLRVKYKDVQDKSGLKKTMDNIRKEYYTLYVTEPNEGLLAIEQQILAMKQR